MSKKNNQEINHKKIISIVGRPNVGKSTLFNRLMGKMTKAIVHDTPGVTRDRQYGIMTFEDQRGRPIHSILVDTGGLFPDQLEGENENKRIFQDAKKVKMTSHYYPGQEEFYYYIAQEAVKGIEESDLVLLVVDGIEGLALYDVSLANLIREKKKKFWVIVNKMESEKLETAGNHYEFFQLGMDEGDCHLVSSAHGRGIEDLKFSIAQYLKSFIKVDPLLEGEMLDQPQGNGEFNGGNEQEFWGRLAIIGAPNSGKSTLMNKLLRKERSLVSPLPGTTVDPVSDSFDLYIEDEDSAEKFHTIQIVDTAGIRKQSSIKNPLEAESVFRALRAMTDAEIILHLVDVSKGITHQDRRLIDIAMEKGKSVILILNKIDLVHEFNRDNKKLYDYIEEVKKSIPWKNLNIFPLSAKDGAFIKLLKKIIGKTIMIRKNKIATPKLNQCIQELIRKNNVMLKGSARAVAFKVKYATVVKMDPPTILLFCNRERDIPEHYKRYLSNGIKENFSLKNTPVHLLFRTEESAKSKKRVSSTSENRK